MGLSTHRQARAKPPNGKLVRVEAGSKRFEKRKIARSGRRGRAVGGADTPLGGRAADPSGQAEGSLLEDLWRQSEHHLGAQTTSMRAETDSLLAVRRRERIFRRSLVAADMIAAAFAVFASIDLSAHNSLRPGFLLVMPLIVIVAKVQGLYDRDELVIRKSTLDELPRLVNLATLFALLVWLVHHVVVVGSPHSETLLLLWVLLIASITLGRMAARRIASLLAPRERCFLIGDTVTARRLRAKLAHSANADLVGAVSADQIGSTYEELPDLLRRVDVHRLVIASGSGLADERIIELVRTAKATGVRVTFFPGVLAMVGSSVVFDDLWGMPLLGIPRFGLNRSSAAVKRGFDMLGASIGLVALSPLFAVIPLVIKLDSRGPVFFRQLRVGRDGKAFSIIKFRSMIDGADAMKAQLRGHNETAALFKLGDDPRVTRVGRWLRKTSIDELPQLLNVLRGQMSLVGPRPLVLDEDEMITGVDRRRLMITPGMTGQWQVLGTGRVPLHEMLKLDYLYIANWSLWNDVKILVRTLGVIVSGGGR
jgi:exopolysaccharide biosynthesis polyprenyl glycosylphosphotransferase